MAQQPNMITQLLFAWRRGDGSAFGHLINKVEGRLKVLARHELHSEEHASGMQTTELFNQACLLLMKKRMINWQGRKHFYNVAALAMRRFLVDEARKRNTLKQGMSFTKTQLDENSLSGEFDPSTLLAIDEALNKIEDPITVRIVELRFFVGYSIRETADLLELPVIQVNRRWAFAKVWLKAQLNNRVGFIWGEEPDADIDDGD